MTKILFLKLQQKQSLFRELWASTAAVLGFCLVGQVEPGCKQTLLLWCQWVMLFLVLLLSLAWSAQSPIGAHQQPENFPGPAGDPWGCIHRRSLTSELACQKERNGCHLKIEIKFLHILGTQLPFACLNYFQLNRQCPQQLLSGRNFLLRRPRRLW